MTIIAGVEFIQTKLRTLPGLLVPIIPPGTVVEFPTAIVYEISGTWSTEAANQYRYLGGIVVDLPVPSADFEAGLQQVRAYIEALPVLLLADTSLGTAVSTFGPIEFSGLINLLPESPGVSPLFGYRWTLQNVKLRRSD